MLHLKGVMTFLHVYIITCKGQDVVHTTSSVCYNVNDDMTLKAEYKGSTPVDGVIWTITGGSAGMTVAVSTCSSRFAIPSGFPVGRMLHDCSSAPKYRLTVHTLQSTDFDKAWGVDFSLLNGSTSSGIQKQTVIQCKPVNESNTGFPWWAIGLIVIGVVAAIIYGVYHIIPHYLKDWLNEVLICRICKMHSGNGQRQGTQSSVKNITVTNEVKKDSEQEIGSNPFDEERMPFTNEANKDIGREIGSNEVKTSSEKNVLKTKLQLLKNDTDFVDEEKKKNKRLLH